jgi:hypothetical protein
LNASVLDLVGKREEKTHNYNAPTVPTVSEPLDDGCCNFFDYTASSPTNNGLKYPENGAPYGDDDDDIPF